MEKQSDTPSTANSQTFKPIKKRQHVNRNPMANYQLETIDVKEFNMIITLPPGEDILEWYAYNVFDFHRQVSMLFSTISEFCTSENCPRMTAGSGFKYLWSDGVPTPVEMAAPAYISKLLDLIEHQLDDEAIFPSTPEKPFPSNFMTIIRNIMKRLFRVYAHFYYHHIEHFQVLQIEKYLNTSFRHFILFNKKYSLIAPAQLEPLRDLISTIE
ncbi:MOB kinase activator-like 1 [Tritrichomonas foetus]|uniref:MOB kinase activator-like 1 n=1 Tax=Tritrichomonas foetus TaxID=1144522 RepID=A0A1J4KRR6_9EUKA|nr:MOB kinase activator-like 1 [Tritrichomonas foetus]|eukprot:OHT13955.1 MOB kinase activator-like 1 [Tritrichomonas foetus]